VRHTRFRGSTPLICSTRRLHSVPPTELFVE
jgi:hypothetical protein